MPVLTETIIDLLDRHTAVEQFGAKAKSAAGMSFTTAAGVAKVHARLREQGRIDLTTPPAPTAIRRLVPGYADHKFWHRVLESRDVTTYAAVAWEQLLPVIAEPAFRVSIAPDTARTWRASPVPRALVYPFGWSNWLSIRITGDHSLRDLVGLVTSLFESSSLQIDVPRRDTGIRGLFDDLSRAVRGNVFSNPKLADKDPQDVMIVTTVLAKHGGSPSIQALSPDDRENILKLVRPSGPGLASLTGHVFQPDKLRPLEYIVFDDTGWFIWNERLLAPEDRNRQYLRCYHNNTVRALAHARQLEGLLRVALTSDKRPAVLRQILRTAVGQLEEPIYRNASLREFVASKHVEQLLQKARRLSV
jgi:hypothetical protein